ncbi:MAG: ABC transporter substrate-binding protein [Alphaproteobacteria bacterium]|nr:ABC transporter substrate-binding protein [Alphaproteobacteria bacterium]
MRRRDLLLAASGGSALLASAGAAAAERSIGWISPESRDVVAPILAAFKSGLAAAATAGADPIRVVERFATDGPSTIPGHVDELQRLGVRLIVAQGAATVPVVRANPSVPVVFGYSGDPIVAGVVKSLSRPGGNATGMTFMAIELMPKRIDMVRTILPGCRKIALLSNTRHAGEEAEIASCQSAVGPHGIELSVHRLQSEADALTALSAALDGGAQAVIALSSALMVQQSPRLAAACLERRTPLISGWAASAHAGALLTYGPNLRDAYRRVAYFVVRVLAGAQPGNLPIEQPGTFELVVNRRTARALGIEIPPVVLAQADEVIE